MHCKYYNSDNKEIPSVTTVLKVLNKPALCFWANSLGFKGKSYKKELDRTAKVGTLVHSYIESNMKKEIFIDIKKAFELDEKSREEVLFSYSAFKLWHNVYKDKMEILHSEYKLVSEAYDYGGTIDLIANIEGENYIVDFKTSSKVYPSMFLQLAAYANMAKENGIKIDRVAILQLGKSSGKFCFTTMPVKKLETYFNIFVYLLLVYRGWGDLNKKDWNIDEAF